MTPVEIFRDVIFANELDNSPAHIYKFSDPDGVRSGKSGWSFGICQFDINNNPAAILCLRECEFTSDEIRRLTSQTLQDMAPMHAKLLAHGEIVNRYDRAQLQECLDVPARLCRESGIAVTTAGLIALADYHNQFYMSKGGKCHTWLRSLSHAVTPADVYTFKKTLPWWTKRSDDVKRRHQNIVQILAAAGL